MSKLLLVLLLYPNLQADEHKYYKLSHDIWMNRSTNKAYRVSQGVLIATHTLDIMSSIGKYELNPLVRRSDGKFSVGRGVGLKTLVVGSNLLLQHTLIKKYPRLKPVFTKVNIGWSLGNTIIIGRNFRIKK